MIREKKKLNVYMALGNTIGKEIFRGVLKNPSVIIKIVFWDNSKDSKEITRQCARQKIQLKLAKSSFIHIDKLERPYLFICAGFGFILKKNFLDHFKRMAYNIHPSLLPLYRGRHPVQWAIAYGEPALGCTVHRLSSFIDAGDIIYQKKIKVNIEENLQDISQRLIKLAVQLCNRLIRDCCRSAVPKGIKQKKHLYWRRRWPGDGRINWKEASSKIINIVRAATPSYPAFAKEKTGAKIVIDKCIVSSTPGLVLRAYPKKKEYVVSTYDGIVMIHTESRLKQGDRLI